MTEKDLIENYLNLCVMLGHIAVAWWSASVFFCGIILKLTLEYKLTKENATYSIGLIILVVIFFLSLLSYGLFCAWYISHLNQGILALLPLEIIQKSGAIGILSNITLFYLFPTTTFVIMLLAFAWLAMIKRNSMR